MEFISNEIGCYPSTKLFEVTETTEEWYDHFFGCVPPIRDGYVSGMGRFIPGTGMFMVGEVHTHIFRGDVCIPCYRMLWIKNAKFYSAIMPIDFSSDDIQKVLNQCA